MVNSFLRQRKIQIVIHYCVDFLKRNPIHCTSYLTKRYIHWSELVFWIFSLFAFFVFGLFFGLKLVQDYKSRGSAITNNIDFTRFNTSFPSLTICPHDILDDIKVEEFIRMRSSKKIRPSKAFLRDLSRTSAKWIPSLPYNTMPEHNYLNLIFNLSKVFDIRIDNKTAVKIITEVGICYTINNVLSGELHVGLPLDLNPYPKVLNEDVLSQAQTFNFFEQFPTFQSIKHNITGNITFYAHSPYDIPASWSRPAGTILGVKRQELILTAVVKEISYDKKLLNEIWIEDRRCRSKNEKLSEIFSLYSHNLCLMECRVPYIQEICNCIPHFYHPKLLKKNWKVCNARELKCFKQHMDIFRNSNIVKCSHCLPNCIDQIVLTKIENKTRKHNNNSIIHIQVKYPPLEAHERNVIYTQLDYMVTLSSVLSAFFGFCVYSLLDCIYFFTIRIYWFRKGYRGSVDED